MKLYFILLLTMVTILAFLHLCKKMGIDVNTHLTALFSALGSAFGSKQNTQQNLSATPQTLYQSYGTDYEAFGNLVWACLNATSRISGLNPPDSASGIFCAKSTDRIKSVDGKLIFMYEVELVSNSSIRDGKFRTIKADIKKIHEAIAENLPDYMYGGYTYSGIVDVWQIDFNHVRIEILDVGRIIC